MNDSSLRELQECFQEHVLHGGSVMPKHVARSQDTDATIRLGIYANAYRLRLLEALQNDYPVMHTLAGDELFARIGRDYIDTCPSTHFSIRYFGQHLAAFIDETPDYREIPVLAEMARLEWKLTLAFDAADSNVIDEETLSSLPSESWPAMRLRFSDSLQRQDFFWNAPEIWRTIDQHMPPQTPVEYETAHPWLIWRHDLQNYFRPLDTAEAFALDSLRNGNDFAAICSGLCDHFEPQQVGLKAAGYLKNWIRMGIVSEVI